MNPVQALLALLVFPGLAYAVPMGWLMLGGERKLRARFQGRIGPPITQPFWDTVKLLAKWPAPRVPGDTLLLTILPLLSLGSAVGALALLPVTAGDSGFTGDLILLVTLLELPPLCLILAGYASRSIYGEVGATREAVVSIAANVPFLTALIAMATAAGSLHISAIATGTPWSVRIPAIAGDSVVPSREVEDQPRVLGECRAGGARRPAHRVRWPSSGTLGTRSRARVGGTHRFRNHARCAVPQRFRAAERILVCGRIIRPRSAVDASRLSHRALENRTGHAPALALGVDRRGRGAGSLDSDEARRTLTCPRFCR